VLLERKIVIAVGIVAMAVAGCDDETSKSSPGTGGDGGTGGSTHQPPPPPISAKANVKLKTKDRLLNDLGNALELDDDQLCNEVGLYPCGDVHSIALGGVDAYGAGVYEPLKASAVTTPIAVDRLVLSACQTRAHLDFQDLAAAAIFTGLEVTNGKLVDVQAPAVADVITSLYRRVHLRNPKASEVEHLRQLYVDVESAGSSKPAQDWAALGCYAVGTMMESVFY